jgi:UDP-N-acetyl-D-mannosaminuronic acid dehydrogenase
LSNKIASKIDKKQAKIAVLGLGYVGLPTSTMFANVGFQVVGIDVNKNIVNQINEGTFQTKEAGLSELILKAQKKGLLTATDSASAIADKDVIIICVQTPLSLNGKADLSFLEAACTTIAEEMKPNTLIVIQSTIPPQTTKNLIIPTLETISKLKCGKDFWLVFCPERMAPGTGLKDLSQNSRLIGANDHTSSLLGKKLFQSITDGDLLVTDIPSAEISKLAENTFRYVNIAFANELALLCKQTGADVLEVIRLANTHPRVNIHTPGPGAGGPCLSKDSHILLVSTQKGIFKSRIIKAAVNVNENMPKYIAKMALDALSKNQKAITLSKIAVLGTAYKADINDARQSPSHGIIDALKQKKIKVFAYDPNCEESFGAAKAQNLEEALTNSDCIILAVDHKAFLNFDLDTAKLLMRPNPIIIDAKRIINPVEAKNKGFKYYAPSLPDIMPNES